MRFGLVISGAGEPPTLPSLGRQAEAAERYGLDLVWIEESGALIVAAALAAVTSTLRLAACVPLDRHPLAIAEAAAVADNCSNGRLLVALRDEPDGDRLDEAVEVLLSALAPSPFEHHGDAWTVPALLPENSGAEQRLRMTPAPAQLELPVWLVGPGAAEAARGHALAHVADYADNGEVARRAWQETRERLSAGVLRLRRPALRDLDTADNGEFDFDALVERLRGERRLWGLDTVLWRLPRRLCDNARAVAVAALATEVVPRVALDSLPPGLEDHWKETLPALPGSERQAPTEEER